MPATGVLHGRYLLSRELGVGAYGVVSRGRDLQNDRRLVAVKTVDLSGLPSPRANIVKAMVEREVELLRCLDHPNVLSVIDFLRPIDHDNVFHIVLECCEGCDLEQLIIARGALVEDEARHVFKQCVDGLRYLQANGIVHRDIKPANVCFVEHVDDLWSSSLTSARVKLIDFGLARKLPQSIATPPPPVRRGISTTLKSFLGRSPTSSPGGSRHGKSNCSSPGGSRHGAGALWPPQRGGSNSVHGGDGLLGLFAAAEDVLAQVAIGDVTLGVRDTPSAAVAMHGESGEVQVPQPTTSSSTLRRTPLSPCAHFELSAHGSRAFAPPEVKEAWRTAQPTLQVSARAAARVDVFSLGEVLSYMLTGVAPDEPPPHCPPTAPADGYEAAIPSAAPVADSTDMSSGGGCGCFVWLTSKRSAGGRAAGGSSPRLLRLRSELRAEAIDLLDRMTVEAAEQRIGLSDVAQHPWLAEAQT